MQQDTVVDLFKGDTVEILRTHSCIRREGLSPSLNFTSFSQRLSMRASCFSVSRINSRDTILFITLSTSAGGTERQKDVTSSIQNKEQHFRSGSGWPTPTFIIIFEANVTRLNDLCQVYVKSSFSVFFWYIGSFCLDVSPQFRGLVKEKNKVCKWCVKPQNKNNNYN